MKFLLRFVDSFPVLAINNENETLCSCVVMSPEWSNLVLSSDVPYVEFYVLVRHSFYIETDRWDGGDRLVQLQFVENRRLSSGIETQHQQPHLFIAKNLAQCL